MRAFNIVGALALATTSTAFFPFYPDYRCAETKECIELKGTDEGHVSERGNGLSVRVVQKIPENDDFSVNRIRTLGEQLKRKYQRGRRVIDPSTGHLVAKRANTYSVMTAATPSQQSSAGIDQDGTDWSYFAQVQLGSTNAPMYLLLDTGADSSWVMGNTCTSGPCSIHDLYDPTASTTYSALGQSFSIQYGSGSVSGVLGSDDLTLAGMKLPITLGIANVTSNDFNNFPIDGILGLSLAKSDHPSFIDSLIASKALKSNVFGISLNRASDGPNTGEINFGALDTSKYSGDLTYTSVSTAGGGFWSIPMANVGFGTAQAGITSKLAYIDTGTSFIFCSPSDAKILHSNVPGATSSDDETWHVPCTTTTSITFTFGSTSFSVSPKDWISQGSSGICTSNIYGRDIVSGNWLLGDTFLKNVYALFDADQSRVGFAQKGATATATAAASSTTAQSSSPTGMPSSIPNTIQTTLLSTIVGSMTTVVSNTPLPGTTATANSATFTASVYASGPSASTTSTALMPGFNGHETLSSSSATATAVDQTSGTPSPTASTKSSGLRIQVSLSAVLLGCLLAVIT